MTNIARSLAGRVLKSSVQSPAYSVQTTSSSSNQDKVNSRTYQTVTVSRDGSKDLGKSPKHRKFSNKTPRIEDIQKSSN